MLTTLPSSLPARTNTIRINLSLDALQQQLAQWLAKHAPSIAFVCVPYNGSAKDYDAQRKLLEHHLGQVVPHLTWRRIYDQGAYHLMACAPLSSVPKTPIPLPKMSTPVQCRLLEMQLLHVLLHSQSASHEVGHGMHAWYINLNGTGKFKSAYKVLLHVAPREDYLRISVVLQEHLFVKDANAPMAHRIQAGTSPSIAAWNIMDLGSKVPLGTKRKFMEFDASKTPRTRWYSYHSLLFALQGMLHSIKVPFQEDVFQPSHAVEYPKLDKLPSIDAVDIIDLSQLNATQKQQVENALHQYAPFTKLTWSTTPIAHGKLTRATIVIQPHQDVEGEVYRWYEENGVRTYVKDFDDGVVGTLGKVDDYSQYKIDVLKLGAEKYPTQGWVLNPEDVQDLKDKGFVAVAGKVMAELQIKGVMMDKRVVGWSALGMTPGKLHVYGLKVTKAHSYTLTHVIWDITPQSIKIDSIQNHVFRNKESYMDSYPGVPTTTSYWLEDAQGNRLLVDVEPFEGFPLSGTKHKDLKSMMSCIATPSARRSTTRGNVQMLSRSVNHELVLYYQSPGDKKFKTRVYLEARGDVLRSFVSSAGSLDVSIANCSHFRNLRYVVGGKKVAWDLNQPLNWLAQCYFHGLTYNLLRMNENSKMTIWEKVVREG